MLPINSILSKIFNQKCYTCLKPLLKNMNFCYAIIKGETLSKLAYGELGKRTSSDIDILIPRNTFKKNRRSSSSKWFYQYSTFT